MLERVFALLPVLGVVILPEECAISLFHTNRDTTAIIGLGVLMTSGMAIDGITAGQNWEGYIADYEEGLRQGVNRALAITPEQEKTIGTTSKRANSHGLTIPGNLMTTMMTDDQAL